MAFGGIGFRIIVGEMETEKRFFRATHNNNNNNNNNNNQNSGSLRSKGILPENPNFGKKKPFPRT